jgi:hypothetical protein
LVVLKVTKVVVTSVVVQTVHTAQLVLKEDLLDAQKVVHHLVEDKVKAEVVAKHADAQQQDLVVHVQEVVHTVNAQVVDKVDTQVVVLEELQRAPVDLLLVAQEDVQTLADTVAHRVVVLQLELAVLEDVQRLLVAHTHANSKAFYEKCGRKAHFLF